MSEAECRHVTLIGKQGVEICIPNDLQDDSHETESSHAVADCFLSRFGHTIQDLLKPTHSVKFQVIVNPNYDFYKDLSDHFLGKAFYPEGLSELFGRRLKSILKQKEDSISHENNNVDDIENQNKSITKTGKTWGRFLSYRSKEYTEEIDGKLDRETYNHVCIDHSRLSEDEEEVDREDWDRGSVDQDVTHLTEIFRISFNMQSLVYLDSSSFSSNNLCVDTSSFSEDPTSILGPHCVGSDTASQDTKPNQKNHYEKDTKRHVSPALNAVEPGVTCVPALNVDSDEISIVYESIMSGQSVKCDNLNSNKMLKGVTLSSNDVIEEVGRVSRDCNIEDVGLNIDSCVSLVTNHLKLSSEDTSDAKDCVRNSPSETNEPVSILLPDKQSSGTSRKRAHGSSEKDSILSAMHPRLSDHLKEKRNVRPKLTAKKKRNKKNKVVDKSFFPWELIPLDLPTTVMSSNRRDFLEAFRSDAEPRFNKHEEDMPIPNEPPLPSGPPPPPPEPPLGDLAGYGGEGIVPFGGGEFPGTPNEEIQRDGLFISNNMEENTDNFNPEWSDVAQIYDTKRYDLIQRRWDTVTIANPKKNLTLFQYNIRDPTCHRSQPIGVESLDGIGNEDEPACKRPRMESCTFMYDKLIEELKTRIGNVSAIFKEKKREALAELKRKHHLELQNRSQNYMIMQKHREEVTRFNSTSGMKYENLISPFQSQIQKLNCLRTELLNFYEFYSGLSKDNEDAMQLSPDDLEEVLSIEATISGYRDSYKDSSR